MLPKTESKMFSKSVEGQMILLILPKELLPTLEQRYLSYNNKGGRSKLLDRKGEEWFLMAILWVRENASFAGDVDEKGEPLINDSAAGIFTEMDEWPEDSWDPKVMWYHTKRSWDQCPYAASGRYEDLDDFTGKYALNRNDWRYIDAHELRTQFTFQEAINYQRLQN